MQESNSKPGKSTQTIKIPPFGTHNTLPPFSSALDKSAELSLHVITIQGVRPGPNIYVGGGTHGDEINGMEAAWRIAKRLDHNVLKGSVTVVPVQSPGAFRFRTRLNPFDPIDPDWVYPQDPSSAPGGRYIRKVKQTLGDLALKADCVFDLHTAGHGGSNNPMVIVPPETGNGAGKRSLDLALAFGGDRIEFRDSEDAYGWPVRFTLPFVAARQGRAGLYAESGQGGGMGPEEDYVNYHVTGVFNVMKKLGMLDGEIEEQGERNILSREQETAVVATSEGILERKVKLRQKVRKGDVVAEIHVIPEGVEQVLAPEDGLVTFLNIFGTVSRNETVATLTP